MIALSNTPVLTTERLILRAPTAADWPAWRAFSLSDRAAFVRAPDYDAQKAWRTFGTMIGQWVLRGWGEFVFTLKGDDRALGMVGPWFPEGWPEPEIAWMMWDTDHGGKGLALEAARAAVAHALGPLGWDTAVSYIDPANTASIRLAERLGAVLDPDAATPELAESKTLLAYRHPKQEAAHDD
ncbi:MAG: GNAT family N-acetyltransferase [Paracoccus sp. (in: a-proteobacteria)]|nr:GNAT family N-acetyltransferase [Paracoccus sp. (in: a-proteobacteria)]